MKLSDRMTKIVNMSETLEIWADIGCDHGIVSAELILSGKAEKVIAADVSLPSLYKAKDLAASLGLSSKIECRCGDGMSILKKDEADGAVIAGMGTPLIEKIIENSPVQAEGLKQIVISPNNYPEKLRKWLFEEGWRIEKEIIAEDDGRFYPVMSVKRGKGDVPGRTELYTGVNVKKDDTFKRYIKWLINKENEIIEKIVSGGNDPAEHIIRREIFAEVKDDNIGAV